MDALTAAVRQQRQPGNSGAILVAVADAVHQLTSDPLTGPTGLDAVTDGLSRMAAVLLAADIPDQDWARALIDARRAVTQLAAQYHPSRPDTPTD